MKKKDFLLLRRLGRRGGLAGRRRWGVHWQAECDDPDARAHSSAAGSEEGGSRGSFQQSPADSDAEDTGGCFQQANNQCSLPASGNGLTYSQDAPGSCHALLSRSDGAAVPRAVAMQIRARRKGISWNLQRIGDDRNCLFVNVMIVYDKSK